MEYGVMVKRYMTKNIQMMLDMLLFLDMQDSDGVEESGARLCTHLRPHREAVSLDSVDSILPGCVYNHVKTRRRLLELLVHMHSRYWPGNEEMAEIARSSWRY